MSTLKEYVITTKEFSDLGNLYDEMETSGSTGSLPTRPAECVKRKPLSRNTVYLLSDEEAVQIKNDPRILEVSLSPKELNLKVTPFGIQESSNWNKSTVNNPNYKNWGLLRSTIRDTIPNWGSNGTQSVTGSINLTSSGKHVDVIVCDGHFDPSHPEFSVNADGSGGSRAIQYDWFQHYYEVTGYSSTRTYQYDPYVDTNNPALTSDNNHGTHVAGTIAGNTQGWARNANIYNFNPLGSSVNSLYVDTLDVFDYFRAFHNAKSINPITKRKNPTIVNNSWGYSIELPIANITGVNYRGTLYNGPFTELQLSNFNLLVSDGYAYFPYNYLPLQADITDTINTGIILVGAAGNDSSYCDIPTGIDYNNYIIYNGYAYHYHRGSSPGANSGMICVGSLSTYYQEVKSWYSNFGPRLDIFAPGEEIISAMANPAESGAVADTRNMNYSIKKLSGTSMASPQVTGVLACLLEQKPHLTQQQALDYLSINSTKNKMQDVGQYPYYTLLNSANKLLFYKSERVSTGTITPSVTFGERPASGPLYPRIKNFIKK